MKRIIFISFFLIILLAIAACSKEVAEKIGIRGQITEIYIDEENLFIQGILVEGEVEEDTIYDSANVTINDDTKILKDEQEVTVDYLEEGLTVEVVFDGPVAESYPVQGTAKEIIIIE
ncbi:DUF3221 domain-containing protein [Tepidimicrobium xylanilyticum]|uniref:DUF3221 domain-containing protein n=1 Tax=Tepidimicrobium xylanilyticum TaxID=1123352 RepID=A0A1H2TVN9_9FIRM|nr:DUF3221 domain-containing protein [Tepidimicrobium xylanilyticum]SDW47965.1 Protein of unknown function [Tepidimicrobium xylanilyticum]